MCVMNKSVAFLLYNLIFLHGVGAESFLKATSYPENFNDLSFVERVEVLQSGYEPYESEYNEKGICIKNCAYRGITLEQDQRQSEINTQNALNSLWDNMDDTDQTELPIDTQNIIDAVKNPKQEAYENFIKKVPLGAPLKNWVRVSSLFGARVLNGIPGFHRGIDFAVPEGTQVFSTADGVVVKAGFDHGGCGNIVKIHHQSGLYSVYCHLSQILVKVGGDVPRYSIIGLSGDTGKSTGPHLHYGINDQQDTPINPTQFINWDIKLQ